MNKYYTRACNFYYGAIARQLISKKLALPLCGDKNIAFDKIEIISRNKVKTNSKIINLRQIKKLNYITKQKVKKDFMQYSFILNGTVQIIQHTLTC